MTHTIGTRTARLIAGVALLLAASVSSASAETLMMPKRDALMGTTLVVWGVTTQANGTAFTLDYGDGSPVTAGFVADRSYIAFNHTYTTSGNFTATLAVGLETATVAVQVFDGASLTPFNLRGLNINLAIQDGLRYLWTAQAGRAANFPAASTTNWGNGFPSADAALVTLAFENHGYTLANDGSAPTGLYEKYIVRRGLNYVIGSLSTVGISSQPSGFAGQPVRDPCVGVGIEASPCTGLRNATDSFRESYLTGVSILPLAASGALSRVNTEVGGYTLGKTYGEILQRAANALAWGQIDVNNPSRGGWYYNFNNTSSDGSVIGWDVLAMLDAGAAGATVPAWVNTEFAFALTGGLNTDGSLDYQADGNPANDSNSGPQKVGTGLMGLFFIGETAGPRVAAVQANISSWWTGVGGIGGNSWGGCPNLNKSCGYTMFNNFKGLKLQHITTLPGVARPAGPGSIPAGDWYADYQDWLVANQTSPTTLTGGQWSTMGFSCCYSGTNITAAIAEVILSPVALVLPDPVKFATLGLSPFTATNPAGDDHTVTAHAESTIGTPVPGATVNFTVLTGPNAGAAGTGPSVTDASGNALFTYTSNGTTGTDTVQANIGTLKSNVVAKTWVAGPPKSIVLTPATATNTVGTSHTVTATVKDSFGNPVPGATVTFTVTAGPNIGVTGTGVTDASGVATFSYTSNGTAGTDTIQADAGMVTSNAVAKTWVAGPPKSIVLTPATANNPVGASHTVTATVKDSFGNPVPAVTVTFTATAGPNVGVTGTGVTGASGVATFTYTSTTAGIDTIQANIGTLTSNAVQKIWFQNPAGGQFVIGNLAPHAGGQAVYFWGSQWEQNNPMTGSSGPNAFKGFENSVPLPACGSNWTTNPGNSSNPPATIGAVIPVIVASQVVKNGPVISGNVAQIILVTPNPGYGPAPGHVGTGNVVAILCSAP